MTISEVRALLAELKAKTGYTFAMERHGPDVRLVLNIVDRYGIERVEIAEAMPVTEAVQFLRLYIAEAGHARH